MTSSPGMARSEGSCSMGGKAGQALVPALGELAVLDPVELVGKLRILRLVLLQSGEPGVAQLLAAAADSLLEMVVNTVGNQELSILRPTVETLGEPDLL